MSFERREVRLAAGTLPYFTTGEGPPLLYLHSAGGVRVSGPLEALARSFTIYMPVMPGFDGTAVFDGIASVPDLADLVAEFSREVIGGASDVIGHSFGGWLALWFAVRHPDLIDQLVLECPAGLRVDGKGGLPANPADLPAYLFAHPENLPPADGPPPHAAANQAMLGHYGGAEPFDHGLAERLGEIEALSMVLMGTVDRVIPAETGILLKEKLQRVFLVYVHDAAHAIEVDQPERFLRPVGTFLERGEGYLVNFGDRAAE